MHNKQGGALRRTLAGLVSAALLFTDSPAVLAAPLPTSYDTDSIAISRDISVDDLTVSGADITISAEDSDLSAEAAIVSTGDAAAPAEDTAVSAGDAAVSIEDAAVSTGDVSDGDATGEAALSGMFTLTPAAIEYGEDGSNRTGNLDALFAPRYVAEDTVLTLHEDYTVTYKFFTAEVPGNAAAFAAADGERLETLSAGTPATVCALAESAFTSDSALATATFTVSRRKVVVHYTASEENSLDGREMPEDGRLVIPQADVQPANLTVSVANATSAESSFVAVEELNAALADAIDGDLTLDVSGVDVTEDGYQVVPAQFALAPSFDDNYEIVGNIFGDIYVKKARYYVTFTVNNEGEQWTKTYPLDYDTDKAVKDYSFYSEMTSAVNTLLKKSANTTLVGWSVYTDSFNVPSGSAK